MKGQNSIMSKGKLGILGGMGPQATQMFYQRVLDRTQADVDQDHIPTLILSDTQMPDRTAAILSGDTGAVYERLRADAKILEDWGAACIAIPCNTSHTFVPQLQTELKTPILNMIAETAKELKAMGAKRVGILATDGTVRMGLYQSACAQLGMEGVAPPPQVQELVMKVIYDEIKRGEKGSRDKFAHIDRAIRGLGCDCAVLACTELSVFSTYHPLPSFYVDAMAVLAEKAVTACGYPLRAI